MRFKPPADEPEMMVANTRGHSVVVRAKGKDGNPGTTVPENLRREAIKRGCVPVGGADEVDPGHTPTKAELVQKAIGEMVDGGSDEDFTRDGVPDLKRLSSRVGFSVSRIERDEAWEAVQRAAP